MWSMLVNFAGEKRNTQLAFRNQPTLREPPAANIDEP